MDNGASSYRRFLDGDNKGLSEIVRDYKDGLMLYLNGFVNNISVAGADGGDFLQDHYEEAPVCRETSVQDLAVYRRAECGH